MLTDGATTDEDRSQKLTLSLCDRRAKIVGNLYEYFTNIFEQLMHFIDF